MLWCVLEFQNVAHAARWTRPRRVGISRGAGWASSLSANPEQPLRRDSSWGWMTTKSQRMPWLQAAAAVLLSCGDSRITGQRRLQERRGRGQYGIRAVGSGRGSSLLETDRSVTRHESEPGRDSTSAAGDQTPLDTEVMLQRVRAMIDQSEQRQQRELALRLSQVTREVDTQHQADLLRIQQDFGQQQDATMEYLVRTSGGVK